MSTYNASNYEEQGGAKTVIGGELEVSPGATFDVGARIDMTNIDVVNTHTDGGIIKCGTSGTPIVEDTANMKFMSFYLDNGALSGDSIGQYLRLYITGAGGGGSAGRIFTTVSDVAANTVRGCHTSLSFGTSGSITGLGTGQTTTVHIPATPLVAGTYYGHQIEFWADDAASDISGTTKHAILALESNGAAGSSTVKNAISITGATAADGTAMICSAGPAAATGSVCVLINGAERWLIFTDDPTA